MLKPPAVINGKPPPLITPKAEPIDPDEESAVRQNLSITVKSEPPDDFEATLLRPVKQEILPPASPVPSADEGDEEEENEREYREQENVAPSISFDPNEVEDFYELGVFDFEAYVKGTLPEFHIPGSFCGLSSPSEDPKNSTDRHPKSSFAISLPENDRIAATTSVSTASKVSAPLISSELSTTTVNDDDDDVFIIQEKLKVPRKTKKVKMEVLNTIWENEEIRTTISASAASTISDTSTIPAPVASNSSVLTANDDDDDVVIIREKIKAPRKKPKKVKQEIVKTCSPPQPDEPRVTPDVPMEVADDAAAEKSSTSVAEEQIVCGKETPPIVSSSSASSTEPPPSLPHLRFRANTVVTTVIRKSGETNNLQGIWSNTNEAEDVPLWNRPAVPTDSGTTVSSFEDPMDLIGPSLPAVSEKKKMQLLPPLPPRFQLPKKDVKTMFIDRIIETMNRRKEFEMAMARLCHVYEEDHKKNFYTDVTTILGTKIPEKMKERLLGERVEVIHHLNGWFFHVQKIQPNFNNQPPLRRAQTVMTRKLNQNGRFGRKISPLRPSGRHDPFFNDRKRSAMSPLRGRSRKTSFIGRSSSREKNHRRDYRSRSRTYDLHSKSPRRDRRSRSKDRERSRHGDKRIRTKDSRSRSRSRVRRSPSRNKKINNGSRRQKGSPSRSRNRRSPSHHRSRPRFRN